MNMINSFIKAGKSRKKKENKTAKVATENAGQPDKEHDTQVNQPASAKKAIKKESTSNEQLKETTNTQLNTSNSNAAPIETNDASVVVVPLATNQTNTTSTEKNAKEELASSSHDVKPEVKEEPKAEEDQSTDEKQNKSKKKTTTTKKPKSKSTSKLPSEKKVKKKLNESSFLNFSFSNKKITDYFQIRKSSRKCKSDLDKEKRMNIESAIKNMREDGLEIQNIENKGRGIFATKHFMRGDFVCEYAGEMISYQDAKKREEKYAADPSIGCYMFFFEYKSKSYCIDATSESGRLGRLLNHSKTEFNCMTKLFEINSKPHLILVAARDIKPGEEMTYDYGDRNKDSLESHPWLAE
jgi:histone-lysine N-methyltransferase SETD8